MREERYGLSPEAFASLTEGVRTFPDSTIYDADGGVYYVPFLASDGRVGYIVRDIESGSRETHIYLNPSSSEGPPFANVFLYMGGDNDPSQDVAMHHYMTDPRRKDVPS